MNDQIICRSIAAYEEVSIMPQQNGEPRMILQQQIINFLVPFLPTQLSFSVVAAVSHFSLEKNEEVEIIIFDPNGNVIQKMPWILETQGALLSNAFPPTSVFIAQMRNLPTYFEGSYNIEIHHNGKKIGGYFYDIYRQGGESQ